MPSKKNGFTLAEIIVVVVVLGILAGLAVPVYLGYLRESDRRVMETRASSLDAAKRTLVMRNPTAATTWSGGTQAGYDQLRPFLAAELPADWGVFSVGEFYVLNVADNIATPTTVADKDS